MPAATSSEDEAGGVDSSRPSRGSRSQRRREKARARRDAAEPAVAAAPRAATPAASAAAPSVVIEYVEPELDSVLGVDAASDPALSQFIDVFRKFSAQPSAAAPNAEGGGVEVGADGAESGGGEDADEDAGALSRLPAGLSRKARKELTASMICELKRRVQRPESIEVHDVTSTDPELLIALKTARNSVPVPIHWCSKRRYLQGNSKRGVVKPPFALPAYLASTGIGTLRELDKAADDRKGLKGKTRERARPKMGRVEVDYKVLHDAFFVHMTKPVFTTFGDLYYEGREFEPDRSMFRAGALSPRLQAALGIGPTDPPPWLVNMQRYGPPPSYLHMRIPGLNAPIPVGASFGFGPGQWGHPPVNEFGAPLYGDVFGTQAGDDAPLVVTHWGETAAAAARNLLAEVVVEPPPVALTPVVAPLEAVSATVAAAPAKLDARRAGGGEAASSGAAPALYTVLETRTTELTGGLLGTKQVYTVPSAAVAGSASAAGVSGSAVVAAAVKGEGAGGPVTIALAPEEIAKLSDAELSRRYAEEETRVREQSAIARGADDLSDLLLEQDKKRKRKEAAGDGGKGKKAKTDFKF